jgi:group I intron endonuclease
VKLNQPDVNVIYGLWCICHPGDGVRYVGQTRKGMKARLGVHIAHSRDVQAPVYNWMRKHGAENIAYAVLEVCLPEELDVREEAWIAMYRDEQGARLMNVKLGGGASSGHKNPKQAERMRGKGNPMYGKDRKEVMAYARSFQGPPSDETKRKIAESLTGRKHSEESKEKMKRASSEAWTNERKEKASQARGGSGNHMAKLTEDQVREIRKLREDEGQSYRALAERFGVSEASISLMCRRLTWKHVE